MYRKFQFRMELIGIPFTYAVGILLHYSFILSNSYILTIFFGSVNESLWEHIKVFAFPYIIWSCVELSFVRRSFKKFVVAKICGLYTLILSMTLAFSAYFGFVGKYNFWILDVVISLCLIFISYFVSHELLISKWHLEEFFVVAILALAVFLSMYLTFSVIPPEINFFWDYRNSIYGIPKKTYLAFK